MQTLLCSMSLSAHSNETESSIGLRMNKTLTTVLETNVVTMIVAEMSVIVIPLVTKTGTSIEISHKTVIKVITETTAIVATLKVVTIHAVVTVKDTVPTIERAIAINPFVSIPANAAIRAKEIAAMMATEVHNVLTLPTDAIVTNEALKNDKTAANTRGIVVILADIVNEPTMRHVIAKPASTASNRTSQPRLSRPKT